MNKRNITLSVFVPTYNHEKFISDCLDGIVMQKTTFDFEVIVQDDASKDLTPKIISKYEKKYSFITAVYHKENIYSKGENLNEYFFRNAKGKYMAFCEGDDYWTDPYKLQKQVDYMKKENLVLSFHQGYWVDENLKMLNYQPPLLKIKWSFEDLLNRWPLTASIMFDASVITKEFHQLISITWSGDQMLMLLAADKGDSGMINEYMCNHIAHSKGLTENLNKREWILNRIKSLILLDKLTKYHHHSGILSALNNLYYYFANVHSSSFFEKINYITKAFINLILYGSGDIRIFLYNCKLLIVKRK